ncbi:hypothetical protein B4065_2394 [Caldibacillus thermoamylovorans]|uniref:Uncharacterized protein n=1 Tax=Caldibacillus thermoamylovorans TaxID=35841 RepID=A0ABD4A9L9_9BACI|nr:hypothetical protein B4065_2394 [Caldibacillus thermoamylovorans]KIO66473.1 hypothetical protein B4166_2569 [Caldibacillus thermoamylovorans]KIO73796.1 hypothetical protein B4167_1858 [Caldibacillus thermoamylovorans]
MLYFYDDHVRVQLSSKADILKQLKGSTIVTTPYHSLLSR